MHHGLRKARIAALLGALLAAALAAPGGATAADLASTTLSTGDDGRWRACHDRLLPAGTDAVATQRVRTPAGGLVWASLSGGGDADWDVAIFDARDGALVAGSASPDASELAEGFSLRGREIVVQACLVDGDAGSVRLDAGYVDTRANDADAGPIQLVRVSTPTPEDKNRLTQTGLDLTEHGGRDFVEVVLYGARDAQRLRAAGFEWTVRIADLVQREIANRRADAAYARRVRGTALPSGREEYRRLPDYELEMKELAMRHPNLVRLLTLPHESLEGRQVLGVEIAENVGAQDGRPVFAQFGVHHAREWPSSEHAMEWAYEMVNGYAGGDPRATAIVRAARTIVVPVVNPDGFNLSREAPLDLRFLNDLHPAGLIVAILADPAHAYKRKNCRIEDGREPEPGDCGRLFVNRDLGTDPNRNYGGLWGGPGASTAPDDPTYRGAGPFSEPETQNIRELVSSRQVTGLITNHTFSNLVLRPPGVREQGPPPDEAFLRELGRRMTDQNGYANLKGYELYDTTGTTEDWTYNATRGFGYTFEIGPDEFHPPFEEVVAEWQGDTAIARGGGNREAYYIAAEAAMDRANHSVIEGTAEPGSIIRLRKEFDTRTHDPLFLNDDGETTEPGFTFRDVLDTTLVVPDSGRFEFDANPSTRPGLAARSYFDLASEPARVETAENVVPTVPGAGSTSAPIHYREHEFTVADGDTRDFLRVALDGGDFDDYDLYVYRVHDDGSQQLVGQAASPIADETVILEAPAPGRYLARVVNWAAVDPRYTLEWALFARGPEQVRQETQESWTLTCERPNGQVVNTERVFIDAGERQSFADLCRPSARVVNDPRGLQLLIPRRGVRMSRTGVVRIRARCPATNESRCAGTLRLYIDRRSTRRRAQDARRMRIGRRNYAIAAGRTGTLRVRLSSRNRRYVQRRRSTRTQAIASTRAGSRVVRTTRNFRLLPLRRARR